MPPGGMVIATTGPKADGRALCQQERACHTIALRDPTAALILHYSMKEDSPILLDSELHKTVMTLAADHESLKAP